MRRLLMLLLVPLIALAATALPAQEIAGPEKLKPHECDWLWIAGVTTELGVAWSPAEHLDLDPKHVKTGSALFRPQAAGRYKCDVILIDWENRGIRILTHTVVVSGDGPEPDPDPDPDPDPTPVPPLSELSVVIIEERDDAAKGGWKGAHLSNHLEEVRSYLTSLPVRFELIDDDQPAASGYLARLDIEGIGSRPVFLVRAPRTKKIYAIKAFGKLGAETIQRLKAAGVK